MNILYTMFRKDVFNINIENEYFYKKERNVRHEKIMVSFVVLLSLFLLASCGGSPSTPTVVPTQHPAATTAPGTPTTQPTPTTPSSSVPFKVVSIDMGVNPASIAGTACGQAITVTYTATFHVAPN